MAIEKVRAAVESLREERDEVLFEDFEHAREAVGSIADIAGDMDDLLAESRFDGVEEEIESVVRVVESIDLPLIFEPLDPVARRFRGWARQRLAGITLAYAGSVGTAARSR